ncbi:MAG: CehA/McbA family metallohydrolase [Gemmatimonadota bacterium]
MKRRTGVVLIGLMAVTGALLQAGPNRYGHSDRVERHMLPAVTTGPLDPAWSPDGRWIAFSMRGDIWKVPAEGGAAVALTAGPNYHFEPAWSPDGRTIALTVDTDGNLDIGIVGADGGTVRRITEHRQVDVEPTWSRDGGSIYFVSARAGGFRIYRHDLERNADTLVVAGFQPSISPDGKQVAYVASVQGRLGTGGLWVKELPNGEPRLVHYEETEYRMKPVWTPDAQAFLYVSDEMGSNDVAIVSAASGNPIVLTADARDEYAPTISPNGDRFAFVSNRTGPMVLYTAPMGGGPLSSWQPVALRTRTSRTPTGRVRTRVLGPDGRPMPARVYLKGSDGRGYTPDGGFHRVIAATETHYFHTQGEFEVEVPAGQTTVEALRGYEYKPASTTVDVPANGVRTITLQLNRLIDLPARGWYSGDTHVHDLHQGNFGITHRTMFDQVLAEDLHVANTLIHMDGTRLMGRWEDLTGRPHPLSTRTHILQYGEEFRGGLGHIGVIGIREYILPFTSGSGNTPYAQHALDFAYLDGARAQGGLAGFMHPYLNTVDTPAEGANSLIPVDIALGKGDFYDVATLYSDEIASALMYYKFLNCGFRVPATSGSDNFSDVYRDPPPGADRAYVHVQGPLSLASWMDGIKRQQTFGSTGPLLFLTVAGREVGSEIALPANAPATLPVRVEAVSISPLDSLQIIVNGKVAQNVRATDSLRIEFNGDIAVPDGGWVAARVVGPSHRYVTDSYAFAQTSPVYVVRGGRKHVVAEDGRFLADLVKAIGTRTERSRWRTPAERERFQSALDRASAIYEQCANGGR